MSSLIIVVIITVWFLKTFYFIPSLEERKGNAYEYSYIEMSEFINSAKLCYKIYPKAHNTGLGSNPEGYQVAYLRSDCFFNVAIDTNNISLCDEVKEYNSLYVDGSAYSRKNCLKTIKTNLASGVTDDDYFNDIPPSDFVEIMKQMGYAYDTIPKEYDAGGNSYEERDYLQYLLEIRSTQDFENRLDKLPAFEK